MFQPGPAGVVFCNYLSSNVEHRFRVWHRRCKIGTFDSALAWYGLSCQVLPMRCHRHIQRQVHQRQVWRKWTCQNPDFNVGRNTLLTFGLVGTEFHMLGPYTNRRHVKTVGQCTRNNVHLRWLDKAGHKLCAQIFVKIQRRTDIFSIRSSRKMTIRSASVIATTRCGSRRSSSCQVA